VPLGEPLQDTKRTLQPLVADELLVTVVSRVSAWDATENNEQPNSIAQGKNFLNMIVP